MLIRTGNIDYLPGFPVNHMRGAVNPSRRIAVHAQGWWRGLLNLVHYAVSNTHSLEICGLTVKKTAARRPPWETSTGSGVCIN